MTRVVAVRHGETDWNHERRMQGWAPVPLNETGREQARAAGAWLAEEYEFDRVVSSDLSRTEQTTELLLESIGDRPVSFDPAFRERNLGVYQGLPYSEAERRFPKFGLGQTAYEAIEAVPENGESFREVQTRVVRGFEGLPTADAGTVLLVTHGGPLRILLGNARGLDLTTALSTYRPDNCSVTEFHVGEDVTVRRESVSAWRSEPAAESG